METDGRRGRGGLHGALSRGEFAALAVAGAAAAAAAATVSGLDARRDADVSAGCATRRCRFDLEVWGSEPAIQGARN